MLLSFLPVGLIWDRDTVRWPFSLSVFFLYISAAAYTVKFAYSLFLLGFSENLPLLFA